MVRDIQAGILSIVVGTPIFGGLGVLERPPVGSSNWFPLPVSVSLRDREASLGVSKGIPERVGLGLVHCSPTLRNFGTCRQKMPQG